MAGKYLCKDFGDIGRCFEMLHTHIDDEVEKLSSKQQELEKRLDLCENQVEFACGELKDLHDKHIPNLESEFDTKMEKEEIELWGRKWNLIIRGIEGNDRETPKQTQTSVRIFLNTQLGFDVNAASKFLFTAVHRLPSGPDKRRNIILRLSSLIDRDDIMSAATKLKAGSGFSVTPDLPPKIALQRGQLLKDRREMPPDERRRYKLVYLKQPPFVQLVKRRTPVGKQPTGQS